VGGIESPRRLICPETETCCVDPGCKRGFCRESQRQEEAYGREMVIRGKIVPGQGDFEPPAVKAFPPHDRAFVRRKPDARAILFIAVLLGSFALCVVLKLLGYKVG